MITKLKIKATGVKVLAPDQIMKKIEAGKMVTDIFTEKNRHLLKIEMECDFETVKKVVEFIQTLGKSGAAL